MYPTFVLILHSGMFDTCLFPTVAVSPAVYTVSINRIGNILELESITYSSLGALRQMSLQGTVFVSLNSVGDRVLVSIRRGFKISVATNKRNMYVAKSFKEFFDYLY